MNRDKLVKGVLAVFIIAGLVAFAMMVSGVLANAVAVQPPAPVLYQNDGFTIPFLVSLNTVNGKAYYATINVTAQQGLTATSNVTAYPSSGTSTTNVTIPIGILVYGNPGVYQLNITVTEYNSSTAPQSVLTTYKYTTYVHIVNPLSVEKVFTTTTTSQEESINVTIPYDATGWTLGYTCYYPNTTFYTKMSVGTPSVNVTVIPSAYEGTSNTTVTFNVSVKSNLRFGEIPVTVLVYEFLNGTDAIYAIYMLHFNFFIMPAVPSNAQSILVASNKFVNFTDVGNIKFGNVSIATSDIPATIVSIVKSSNSVQVLFNNSFTGMISFQSNVTPTAIYADGQKLTQVFYTVPGNMPIGTWDMIGNTVYVYADPSNVTVVYNTTAAAATATTTTTVSSMTTATVSYSATTSATVPSVTTSSTTGNSATSAITNFYEQHKTLVLITIAFLFVVIIAVILIRR
jgi:hypothetical protein